jgi:hypothetical protein
MALKNNNGIVKQESKVRVYSTDEAGMMTDAKEYAKRDFTVVSATMRMFNTCETITDEEIAKALITVKYNQIVEARTNRVSYFD